ncbi:MAG: T9SS type A sorting domain-containing protein [Candidatus Poribacteria bacterium]
MKRKQVFIFFIIGFLLICLSNSEAIQVTPPTGQQSITLNLLTGWNLVSCPGTPVISDWPTILSGNPNLFGKALFYNTSPPGYIPAPTLEFGKSYMILAFGTTSVTLQYQPQVTFTYPIERTWNSVGSVSGIVPVSYIKKDPAGTYIGVLRLNPSTGWAAASNIVPGEGYFVFTTTSCQATIPTPFLPPVPFSPPAYANARNPIWESIIKVRTKNGYRELVFGMHSSASDGFDVSLDMPSPPLPDMGENTNASWAIHDPNMPELIRSYVKESPHSELEFSVDLTGPGEIQWSKLPKSYRCVLLYDGQMIKMDQSEKLLLPSGKNSIKVILDALDSLPAKTQLLANYPNPFNPETWIPYELSKDTDVKIMIYSLNGQLVRKLDLGHKFAGKYAEKEKSVYWDGKNEAGEKVNSGVYFYSLVTPNFSQTRKFVIIR